MSPKGLILALLGTACVGAAAAGGFVAIRLNRVDQMARSVGAPNPPPQAEPAPAAPLPAPATEPTSTPETTVPKTPAPRHAARMTTPVIAPAPVTADAAPPGTTATVGSSTAVPPFPPVPVPPPDTQTTPPPVPDPPADPTVAKPVFENVTVGPDAVMGITLDAAVSSATAKVEDKVTARLTRDVTVTGRVVIPAGAKLEGVVTAVDRGGKFSAQARIGIRFTTLILADNTQLSVQTEPIYRLGEPPGNSSASKIGAGAVIGGILGALIGGKKGAGVGTAAGAAGGTAAAANSDYDAVFAAGTPVTVHLTAPLVVSVPHDQDRH
jgi:hypothetical protein